MGLWKVKMPQVLLFYILRLTYLNKHGSDCCKPLVNFQSPQKVDLDSFGQYSSCFCGGADFVSVLLHHSLC